MRKIERRVVVHIVYYGPSLFSLLNYVSLIMFLSFASKRVRKLEKKKYDTPNLDLSYFF